MANIKTSKRLQKFITYLSDGLWHSTKEIIDATGLCAIGTTASELRANGMTVECKLSYITADKSKVYKYRLAK